MNGMNPNQAAMTIARPQSIEPTNMAELQQLAKAAAASGFFGAKTPDQALLIAMAGRDLGLSYSQALRSFHVIEGKPTLTANAMVAVCLVRRDVCESFRTLESTNERAVVETKRAGQAAQSYTFTMADAQRAGVASKQNWAKYPSRMLLARARAALARDVYPDLLLGLYDPDEVDAVVMPSPTPQVVDVRPEAPEPIVTADGEVVAPSELDAHREETMQTILADLARMGREGTMQGLAGVARDISAWSPLPEEKKRLETAYKAARTDIMHRATSSKAAQAAFSDLDAEGAL